MRFLPERLRIRLIISSPWTSKPASLTWALSAGGTDSNKASTVASSALCLMMSELPRSPEISPKAPRIIDLPAPVSPVMMLRPWPSCRTTSSMMAKFLIRSSRNMSRLTFPPLQFLTQNFIITAARQLYQRYRQAIVARLDFVAVIEPNTLLPVGTQENGVAKRAERDPYCRHTRYHDRPIGQCVRTQGSQEDCAKRWRQNRAPGGQRISGRTSGSGNNQPIGAVVT